MSKLDYNIPAPPHHRNKYGFGDLIPGASRFYPTDKPGVVQSAATSFAGFRGWRLRTERRTEKGKPGLRVWRVE
jgi:hypothetical protein